LHFLTGIVGLELMNRKRLEGEQEEVGIRYLLVKTKARRSTKTAGLFHDPWGNWRGLG
jgi:hypothetical protein